MQCCTPELRPRMTYGRMPEATRALRLLWLLAVRCFSASLTASSSPSGDSPLFSSLPRADTRPACHGQTAIYVCNPQYALPHMSDICTYANWDTQKFKGTLSHKTRYASAPCSTLSNLHKLLLHYQFCMQCCYRHPSQVSLAHQLRGQHHASVCEGLI